MDTSNLIRYRVVREATGLSPRVLNYRVRRAGIQAYVDSRDQRQRMIDVRDLPRLTEIEPVPKRRGDSAA
jgi:hypothetical protein